MTLWREVPFETYRLQGDHHFFVVGGGDQWTDYGSR